MIQQLNDQIAALVAANADDQRVADQLAAMQAAAARAAACNRQIERLREEAAVYEKREADRISRAGRIKILSVQKVEGASASAAGAHSVTFIERNYDPVSGNIESVRVHPLHGSTPEVIQAVCFADDMLPTYIRALHEDAAESLRMHFANVKRGYMRGKPSDSSAQAETASPIDPAAILADRPDNSSRWYR